MTDAFIKTSQIKDGKVIPKLAMPQAEGQFFIDLVDGLPGDVTLCTPSCSRNNVDNFRSAQQLLFTVRDALDDGNLADVIELFDYFSSDKVRAAEALNMLFSAIPNRRSDTSNGELEKNVELVQYLLQWVPPDSLAEPLDHALRLEATRLFGIPENIKQDLNAAQQKTPASIDALSAAVITHDENRSPRVEVVKFIGYKAAQGIKDKMLSEEVAVIDGLLERLPKTIQLDTLCDTAHFLRRTFLLIACGANPNAPYASSHDKLITQHAQSLMVNGFPQLSNIITAGKELARKLGNTPHEKPYDKVAATLTANAAPKLFELKA